MNIELLNLMADCHPKSCAEIQRKLNLSRSQLLDACHRLKTLGVNIEHQADNLCLIPTLPLLDVEALRQALPSFPIFYQPILSSTNDFIEQQRATLQKGALCLAEFQTAGRGRRGNQWFSPFGGQLIFSFYWTLEADERLEGLSLAIGLAIAETFGAQVKWPNDVLYQDAKMAGISLDVISNRNGRRELVIGVGINAKLPSELALERATASLYDIDPQTDRTQALIAVIPAIYREIERFARAGIDGAFQQRWQARNAYAGQTVNLLQADTIESGQECGIDSQGHLLVTIDGQIQHFSAGEISLRQAKMHF